MVFGHKFLQIRAGECPFMMDSCFFLFFVWLIIFFGCEHYQGQRFVFVCFVERSFLERMPTCFTRRGWVCFDFLVNS